MLFDLLGGRERFATVDVALVRHQQPGATTTNWPPPTCGSPCRTRPRRGRSPVLERGDRAGPGQLCRILHPHPAWRRKRLRRLLAGLGGRQRRPPHGHPARRERGAHSSDRARSRGGRAGGRPSALGGLRGPDHQGRLGGGLWRPLGRQGGNANVGLWTWDDDLYAWMLGQLTTDALRRLVPEAAGLAMTRTELPRLRALNFVVEGILGWGSPPPPASTPRPRGWENSSAPGGRVAGRPGHPLPNGGLRFRRLNVAASMGRGQ